MTVARNRRSVGLARSPSREYRIGGGHDGRHARLGPGRRLLPGLPGPIRIRAACREARAARALGRAADERRLQGRRPARASPSGSTTWPTSGSTALYLNPVFTAASNHRYNAYDYLSVDPLLGGDAALRELLDAAHARASGSSSTACSTTPGGGSGRSTTSSSRAASRRTATGSTSSPTVARRAARPASPTAAPAGRVTASAAIGRGGTSRRCRSSGSSTRRCASTSSGSPSTGCGSGSTAGGSTCPGHRGPDVLAGVPPPGPGRQPRGVHRRRDLGRGPGVADGRSLRRADELPARPSRSSASSAAAGSTGGRSAARPNYAARSAPLDGPRSASALAALFEPPRPRDHRRPVQPHRQPRHAAGADACLGGTAARCGSRRSSSSRCPGRPRSTTATSSAMEGAADPDCRRAYPPAGAPLPDDALATRAFVRAAIPGAADARRVATGDARVCRRGRALDRDRADGRGPRGRSSRSTPATRPSPSSFTIGPRGLGPRADRSARPVPGGIVEASPSPR